MASSGKIRVLIVDDIAESRDNVAKLLRFEPDVQVVGMAEGGQEGIDLAFKLEPDVVLMDINMPDVDGITAATRVSSRLPNTAVIMMSVQNEPDYLRRSMLAGAREFLAKPFSLDELIDSIRHVHQLAQSNRRASVETTILHRDSPSRGKRAHVVSVFSLKGGVGRSTIAANLAIALHQGGDREVGLVDGNLLYGDLGVMLNLTDNKTIADIVKHYQTMDRDLVSDVLVTHNSGVRVLLAPPDPQQGEQVTPDHLRQVMQHLTAMHDVVVVDTRPSFDENTIALLDMSDQIVLVLTMELTAIKAAKHYLELCDLLGYDDDKIVLTLNRATVNAGIPVADVASSLKGEIAATLSDDSGLALRAINDGVPFMQSAPTSALAREIDKLAALVTPAPDEATLPAPTSIAAGAKPGTGRLGRWLGRKAG